jgi:hypothetical protein
MSGINEIPIPNALSKSWETLLADIDNYDNAIRTSKPTYSLYGRKFVLNDQKRYSLNDLLKKVGKIFEEEVALSSKVAEEALQEAMGENSSSHKKDRGYKVSLKELEAEREAIDKSKKLVATIIQHGVKADESNLPLLTKMWLAVVRFFTSSTDNRNHIVSHLNEIAPKLDELFGLQIESLIHLINGKILTAEQKIRLVQWDLDDVKNSIKSLGRATNVEPIRVTILDEEGTYRGETEILKETKMAGYLEKAATYQEKIADLSEEILEQRKQIQVIMTFLAREKTHRVGDAANIPLYNESEWKRINALPPEKTLDLYMSVLHAAQEANNSRMVFSSDPSFQTNLDKAIKQTKYKVHPDKFPAHQEKATWIFSVISAIADKLQGK